MSGSFSTENQGDEPEANVRSQSSKGVARQQVRSSWDKRLNNRLGRKGYSTEASKKKEVDDRRQKVEVDQKHEEKINECELGRGLLRNGNRTKNWPDGSHERERKGIVGKERPGVCEEKHHHDGRGDKRERGNVRYLL